MKIKVENESYIKDTKTGVVQETDKSKLRKHRAIRKALNDRSKKIDNLIEKINKLEQQMEEINGKLNS
jgi:proteasome assembly chaperone (PAC2) family protein